MQRITTRTAINGERHPFTAGHLRVRIRRTRRAIPSLRPMSTHQPADARWVLDPDHPLARVIAQLSMAERRCLVVSGALVVGACALVSDVGVGAPLTVAATIVLVALLVRIGALTAARDRRAVELIAEGRGALPVGAVARMRRRLLDPAQRARLARTLDMIRTEAMRPQSQCHPVRPLYSVPVVRALSSELADVARLVREGGGLRGLAATELLVTDGLSPLYGNVEPALHQELGRIRFLLASRDPDGLRVDSDEPRGRSGV